MRQIEIFFRFALMFACAFPMVRAAERFLHPHPKVLCRAASYLIFVVTLGLPSWVGDENPILLFPFFMLVFLFCYAGPRLARLVSGGIFFTLLVSLSMLVDTLDLWGLKSTPHILGMFLGKLAAWLLLAWVIGRGLPREGVRLSSGLWRLLGGLTLAPLMITLAFSLWKFRDGGLAALEVYMLALYRISFTTLPFVFLAALALFFTAILLSRHEFLERESRYAALREDYYENIRREQRQVRVLRHDLRNHLTALRGLLEEGEAERAGEYLSELCRSPALSGGRRYCENETANVVLAIKAATMEAEGITADFSLTLPPEVPLTPPELCALLGNALDNAIESARTAQDRQILLRARVDKGLFMLRVENAVGGAVNPGLSTTKPDTLAHGFGLAGMRELAARHGGSLEVKMQDGRFTLIACLPCAPEE